MFVDVDVAEVGRRGRRKRPVRDARRKLRRARRARKAARLEERAKDVRDQAHSERRGAGKGSAPTRRGGRPQPSSERRSRQPDREEDWAQQEASSLPEEPMPFDDLFDDTEPFDDDAEVDPFLDEDEDEEQLGGVRDVVRRTVDRARQRVAPRALTVGALRVVAPAGERGLVLPIANHVYLVSHWPASYVAKMGERHLGRVMVDAARLRLGAGSQVGGVGFLPLAVLLVQQAAKAAKAGKAANAAPAAPAVPAATTGRDCGCGRRQ